VATIGRGLANASLTLLPAAAFGYAAGMAIDLKVTARLRDDPANSPPDDPDRLLPAIYDAWLESGFPSPAEHIDWIIDSGIPIQEGLNSSSAVGMAAVRALAQATGTDLSDAMAVDLVVYAHATSGISEWGDPAQAWASAVPGWHVSVIGHSADEGRVLHGPSPNPEDYRCFLLLRDEDAPTPATIEQIQAHASAYEPALAALQKGDAMGAITHSGRASAQAAGDHPGRHIANDAVIKGARAAGLCPDGPTIVVFVLSSLTPTVEFLTSTWKQRGLEVFEAKTVIIAS